MDEVDIPMKSYPYAPKVALLSVSDKTNITELARALVDKGISILSTGGTAKTLKEANIPVTNVSSVTGFAEIMQGRVKTLHPKIHGGILGKRDVHQNEAKKHDIDWIDLVVCNLYPFTDTVKSGANLDTAIENIDIGGPSMIRSAAKNFAHVSVLVDPDDYANFIDDLPKGICLATRKKLATKAFAHTANYDAHIHDYLNTEPFPETLNLSYTKLKPLRYGENPHQKAALYVDKLATNKGLMKATQLQGKALSYNNYLDGDAALACVSEFSEPCTVVVKHANPCGVAIKTNIDAAFHAAWQADSLSAFGSIVALNRPITDTIADFLLTVFIEVIIAPEFSDDIKKRFSQKPNIRLLEMPIAKPEPNISFRFIQGGLLAQEADNYALAHDAITMATNHRLDEAAKKNLQFAWQVAKHVKSNGIIVAKDGTTQGIGAGQVSRVDAVKIALEKSTDLTGAVLASDAFFPFADSIELIAKVGIKTIIQPGGSIKDQEVINACEAHDIAMAFTGQRCFRH